MDRLCTEEQKETRSDRDFRKAAAAQAIQQIDDVIRDVAEIMVADIVRHRGRGRDVIMLPFRPLQAPVRKRQIRAV